MVFNLSFGFYLNYLLKRRLVLVSQINPLSLSLVKKNIHHNVSKLLSQFLVTLMLGIVLLTSCSIKRGVKVLFDIPIKTERVTTAGHYLSLMDQSRQSCLKCADFQVLASGVFDHSLIKAGAVAILVSAVFVLFILPLFQAVEKLDYGVPTIGGPLPKYLLFSKLIFYDIR